MSDIEVMGRADPKNALDQFAQTEPREPARVPTIKDMSGLAERVIGAQNVAVYRDESRILTKLKALAAAAGPDWYYRFPVKNKKAGTTDWIEGPSIKLANDLARMYGNCDVDIRTVDLGDSWLFYARFTDFETGFSLTRPFQQQKNAAKLGGSDDARRLDISFQIGTSKAIRNVVVNALQTFADYAFDQAKNSLVEAIGKNLDGWRQKMAIRITELGIDIHRIEAVLGRSSKEWVAPDMARIIAMMKAVQDGMATLDETFPPLDGDKPQQAEALDKFAAESSEQPQQPAQPAEFDTEFSAADAYAMGKEHHAKGRPLKSPPPEWRDGSQPAFLEAWESGWRDADNEAQVAKKQK